MLALGLAGLIIVAYLAQDKLDIATEIDWNYFHSQLLARGKVIISDTSFLHPR